ncbi:MAG TPA: hypothetical protein VGF34_14365 [Stellaceae bacterium]
MQQFADIAAKGGADRGEVREVNAPCPGFDAVIGQPRHSEDPAGRLLGQAKRPPAAAQSRSNAGLRIIDSSHRSRPRWRAEQAGTDRGAETGAFRLFDAHVPNIAFIAIIVKAKMTLRKACVLDGRRGRIDDQCRHPEDAEWILP